jgi:hypothetical protein
MAAPSSSAQCNLFERSDRYQQLRQIALTTKPPGDFDNEVFIVAVLNHKKDAANAAGNDFIWLKVKGVESPYPIHY